jgi:hypothetical protein
MIGDTELHRDERRGSDRRTEKRFSRLEPARAVQSKPQRSFACVLRDISEHGCRLVGVGIEAIHSPFQLIAGGAHTRHCEVVWRSKKTIGVRFVAAEADPASEATG